MHENMNYLTEEIKPSNSFISSNSGLKSLKSEIKLEQTDQSFSINEVDTFQYENNSLNNQIGLKDSDVMFFKAPGNYFSNYLCYKIKHDLQPERNQHIDA